MGVFKVLIQLTTLIQVLAMDLNIKDLTLSFADLDMGKILDDVMRPLNLNKMFSNDIQHIQSAITLPPFYGKVTGMPAVKPGEVKLMPVPMYVMPQTPMVVPMTTYFERVVHDHPPIDKIRKMIEADEKRWNKKKSPGVVTASESISSETDSMSSTYEIDCTDKEIDPVEYYDDILHIKH